MLDDALDLLALPVEVEFNLCQLRLWHLGDCRLVDRLIHSVKAGEFRQRGLPYKSGTAIDPTAAALLSSLSYLESHNWFDDMGRTIASWSPSSAATKQEYDAHNRVIKSYVTDRNGEGVGAGSHAKFASVVNDVVLTQSEYTYATDTVAAGWIASGARLQWR